MSQLSMVYEHCGYQVNLVPSYPRYLSRQSLLLWPCWPTSHPSVAGSQPLRDLVFTGHTSAIISHDTHSYYFMPETPWHRRIRLGKAAQEASDDASVNGEGTPGRASPPSPRGGSPRSPRIPAVARKVGRSKTSPSSAFLQVLLLLIVSTHARYCVSAKAGHNS